MGKESKWVGSGGGLSLPQTSSVLATRQLQLPTGSQAKPLSLLSPSCPSRNHKGTDAEDTRRAQIPSPFAWPAAQPCPHPAISPPGEPSGEGSQTPSLPPSFFLGVSLAAVTPATVPTPQPPGPFRRQTRAQSERSAEVVAPTPSAGQPALSRGKSSPHSRHFPPPSPQAARAPRPRLKVSAAGLPPPPPAPLAPRPLRPPCPPGPGPAPAARLPPRTPSLRGGAPPSPEPRTGSAPRRERRSGRRGQRGGGGGDPLASARGRASPPRSPTSRPCAGGGQVSENAKGTSGLLPFVPLAGPHRGGGAGARRWGPRSRGQRRGRHAAAGEVPAAPRAGSARAPGSPPAAPRTRRPV